mgnify:CR=1 FL=1
MEMPVVNLEEKARRTPDRHRAGVDIVIDGMRPEDWEEVRSIYAEGIDTGNATFEALLDALIEASEKAGIWSLQGGIFPENAASLHLIRKHGFREIGRREKLGRMAHGPLAGAWRDVVLVKRRSRVAGTD